MLRVVTGCWHDSRTQEFVLHFNSSINNDPMCLPRPHRNRHEQPLLPTLTSLYILFIVRKTRSMNLSHLLMI